MISQESLVCCGALVGMLVVLVLLVESARKFLPELSLFAGRRERNRALLTAYRRQLARWQLWVLLLVWVVAGTLLLTEGPWFRRALSFHVAAALIVFVLWMIVGGIAPWVIVGYVFRKDIRRAIRQQLNAIGKPVCLNCGYNLTGLPEPRCPECGEVA